MEVACALQRHACGRVGKPYNRASRLCRARDLARNCRTHHVCSYTARTVGAAVQLLHHIVATARCAVRARAVE